MVGQMTVDGDTTTIQLPPNFRGMDQQRRWLCYTKGQVGFSFNSWLERLISRDFHSLYFARSEFKKSLLVLQSPR